MSLKALPIPPVPEETAHVARAAFPRGNVLMQLRDTLGTIYTDEAFADLFPTHGQPALAAWRLAPVTLFQFLEGLTDRQAACVQISSSGASSSALRLKSRASSCRP